jgi:hypothetical protein
MYSVLSIDNAVSLSKRLPSILLTEIMAKHLKNPGVHSD